MKRTVVFKDTIVEFYVEYCDFGRLYFTDSLIEYYPEYDVVSVDERADEEYVLWAALHECISVKYKNLAPDVKDLVDRCGMIDIMLINAMPSKYRQTYRKKRIEMYAALLHNSLNPSKNDSFRRAIMLLENYR